MKTCGGIFDVDAKKQAVAELEAESAGSAFWNNQIKAQDALKRLKTLKRVADTWEKAHSEGQSLLELYQLANTENDASILPELVAPKKTLEADVAQLEFMRKLSGEDDASPAVLTVHSGAGGTESCDWCEILFRMYCRWLERKGYAYTVMDIIPGEEAGLRSVSINVAAEYAYGHLKAEIGVHRLVRISPFDANARRHTSFASVYSYPLIEETDDYEIDLEDLRIDTYRSGGAGGQHVNKTDSAVRMTHIPTNIVVACQTERSQMKNRATAMRMLKSRVKQHYKEVEEKKRQDKMVEKKKIEWGSQIRSYVLHPYNLIKDHRTDVETSNTQAVLDGEIDEFIETCLLQGIV